MTHSHDAGKDAMAVIKTNPRVPFPRGLGTVVLAIVCAVMAVILLILILAVQKGAAQRQQLACQVEHLGGQPVGGISCPPSPKAKSPRATPTSVRTPDPLPQPSSVPTTVIVMVPGQTPHVIYSTRTIYVTPSPRATSSSPRSSASPRPSSSPTRICPVPIPLVCPVDKRQ